METAARAGTSPGRGDALRRDLPERITHGLRAWTASCNTSPCRAVRSQAP